MDAESGVNDYLDRDGSRTPIEFHISNDHDKHPVDAQVVQAATKWKRVALKQFGMQVGEGLCTDMRAVRKDYFLDHDHSAYVDQWDWERVITPEQRNLAFLKEMVRAIWKSSAARRATLAAFPQLQRPRTPTCRRSSTFLHAEDILEHVPRPAAQAARDDDPARSTRRSSSRHRLDAAGRLPARDAGAGLRRLGHRDASEDGRPMHGLNGDILVWNPVTKRRHELTSMGVRVNAETLAGSWS